MLETKYQDLIETADRAYRDGRYKEAHIAYGQAVATSDGVRDSYCRHMRGICSRLVASQRLQKAIDHPEERAKFLNQTARWLAKSEANLDSAFHESPEGERAGIRLEQARTEELMARFVEMAGGDPQRRLAEARRLRAEGLDMMGRG